MLTYILRRILTMIPTLLVISMLVFVIIQLPPGDYLESHIAELQSQGESVDEQRLRASKVLQAQIKHHSGLNPRYTMDAYVEGLQAASRCEVPLRVKMRICLTSSLARRAATITSCIFSRVSGGQFSSASVSAV